MFLLPKHKVYVNYDHDNDQIYLNNFTHLFENRRDVLVSKAGPIEGIAANVPVDALYQKIRTECLGDTNVNVVLIGSETWKSKIVDWEIGAGLRHTPFSPHSGLLGILLPTYNFPSENQYDPYTIPPRFQSNLQCGFAKIHMWSDNPDEVFRWLEEAFHRRTSVDPDNSYPAFVDNRTEETWQPQPQGVVPGTGA